MKTLLLVLVFVAACYVAMVIWQRLLETQQKLADLHDEMRRNDRKLESEFKKIDISSESPENPDAGTQTS